MVVRRLVLGRCTTWHLVPGAAYQVHHLVPPGQVYHLAPPGARCSLPAPSNPFLQRKRHRLALKRRRGEKNR